MKKAFLTLVLVAFLLVFNISVFAAPPILDAKAWILIDSKTGQVLYEQNPNLQLYPASTTKIITAILAIENGNLEQVLTASNVSVSQRYADKDGYNYGIGINGSNVGIVAGEQLKTLDLLHALLIKSANDAANIIADNLSPTRMDFVNLMNKRAKELGASNTNFTNPSGLDTQDGHPNHLTTVSDMAKIARHAMSLPVFSLIVQKQKYTMPDTNKHASTYWPVDYVTTTNKLFLYNKYKSDLFKTTGMKTGYTLKSGFNMIASGTNDTGMDLICVVFGGTMVDSQFLYSKNLLDYGFGNFSIQSALNSDEVIQSVQVSGADGDNLLDIVPESEFKCVLPNDKSIWQLVKNISINDITAPINKGDIVGAVEVARNGQILGKVNLVAAKSISAPVKKSLIPSAKETPIRVLLSILAVIVSFILLRETLKIISRYVRTSKLNAERNE